VGGFNSFDSFEPEEDCPAIYDAFTSNPSTNPAYTFFDFIESFLEGESSLVDHLNTNLGLPVATVVFENGDVAQFQLISPDSSNTCRYVKGSARNKNGQFIPDQVAGGDGTSSGIDYVQSDVSDNFDVFLGDHSGLACTWSPVTGNNCQRYNYLTIESE